jgi:RNA polymerase sigma-54 factor
MKQSLHLGHEQRLHMTPQLQQAIRLLQLSTLDLQTEIQNVLDSNFMLEVAEEEGSSRDQEQGEASAESADRDNADSGEQAIDASQTESIPEDLAVDSKWDDVYDGSTSYSQPSSSDEPDQFETYTSEGETLHDHLTWQMQLTPFSETDRAIAMTIIDSIDDDGYLHTSLEEILSGLNRDHDLDEDVELDEVEAVLHRIQHFDPVGVAARDLSECLLIQLQQFDEDTPYLKQTREIVSQYLEMLGGRDFSRIMRLMKMNEDDLRQVIQLIQTLNPKPGAVVSSEKSEYVIPDVIVFKNKGKWVVELNPETMPKIRVNNLYAGMIRRSDNSEDANNMRNQLQEARWFLKSLQSRNETLLKVARCIVERQRDFFEYGEEAMKPLVLRDVAEAVSMHESTISRVTTQKFMHTPKGLFEFKYFFSSHVSTTEGGECSATAIRAMIKKLIAAENHSKPLSDNKIAEMLMKQGIKVARRTVTKYREAMLIPSSNERKRLA